MKAHSLPLVPAALVRGGWAAVRAPLWLRADRLQVLVDGWPGSRNPGAESVRLAAGAARRAVRLLARLPGDRWRGTCLYLSIAEALVLRGQDCAGRLQIGVRKDEDGAVLAHAWTDTRSAQQDSGEQFAVLTRSPVRGGADRA